MYQRVDKKLNRIFDANFNRAKEGLRVCEDICRFILDAKGPTRDYKTIRHELTSMMGALRLSEVISARDTGRDVGRGSTGAEFKRRGTVDIFFANSQRAKESIRVLEEFSKLRDKKLAEKLKKLRYKIYALEKKVVERC